MELGGHDSSSSSCSSSSFDSCSDLLSLVNNPSYPLGLNYSLDLAKATYTLPGIFCMMADLNAQIDSDSLASAHNGKSIKGMNEKENSSQSKIDEGDVGDGDGEGEEAILAVKAQSLETHAAELSSPSCADIVMHATKEKRAPTTSSISEDAEDPISKAGRRVSSGEAEFNLQQLENSIKFFDLYHRNTQLPHPLRSMSSRCSSPDLNAFEQSDLAEVVHNKQIHRQSFSSGVTEKDMMLASTPHKKLNSAGLIPWLNYEESRKSNLKHVVKKDDFQSAAHRQRLLAMHVDDLGETTEPSNYSPDWKEATSAHALYDKEKSGHTISNEELLGKAQVTDIWSNSPAERKTGDLTFSDNNDLGPDEISRYLESLDVNEAYVDALKNKKREIFNLDEDKSHAGCYSNTDASQSSSISELPLLHTHCVLSANEIPFMVNSVQVVGARQQRGGSSMWQRMVGVKDHTVYCIKVVSGKHEWEVQRRYRDFMNFYQQLKRVFSNGCGTPLPPFSDDLENDSRRVLGNTSPIVVEARVVLIEKFLQSLLQVGPPFNTATPLFWFLRPPQGAFEKTGFEEHLMVQGSTLQKSVDVQLGTLNCPHLQSPPIVESSKREQSKNGGPRTLGKTIKLVLTIHQNHSLREVLHAQHDSCAGCYRHLEYEKGLIQGFAQAFGRRKPRFCEYTGQLFCSSCHLNELAVLPAYVLWHWDFAPKRVCQFAKAYLDSIYDQPLLCLSTANPYLYQRVPCLSNVQENRAKLSRVLSCMRCSSRSRILNIMGSRRYLLENNDFFALRDLEDLSKGAFAVLPGLLTAVLKTLMLHVTKQCSVCQDSGEWCGAGILCEAPFQPIFPFNEEVNVVNCKMCSAPFHRDCFAKCPSCPACPKNWVGTSSLKSSLRR